MVGGRAEGRLPLRGPPAHGKRTHPAAPPAALPRALCPALTHVVLVCLVFVGNA